MLDTIQAALHHTNGHAYFFQGDRYMKWKPGKGVVPLADGRRVRRLGVDGWTSLPDHFKSGIDAAFHYPSRDAVYFFKGAEYVKWVEGTGAVPTAAGAVVRQLGVTGWATLPATFRSGIDAALFHHENGHAYFFKSDTYVKYKLGTGVVALSNGDRVRRLGHDGWNELPTAFKDGVDAALYYRDNERIYFFKNRQYARWDPEVGLDARYPRRIGLEHGDGMCAVRAGQADLLGGGWPGLGHIVGGPLVGHTTTDATRIWLWLTDAHALAQLRFLLNGEATVPRVVNVQHHTLNADVEEIRAGSLMREFHFTGLRPHASNSITVLLNGTVLETVEVRTPPPAGLTGDVDIAFASCLDFSNDEQAAPVIRALGRWNADLRILCGDNCYYIRHDGERRTGFAAGTKSDWNSTGHMLRRQLQARNHPEFAEAGLNGAVLSTWDDHDFGFNNAEGQKHDDRDGWVKRDAAAHVHRAMWPNPYVEKEPSVRYNVRWGPVEVFLPDARYHKDSSHDIIWGSGQTQQLIADLRASDAPVKLIVTAGQFLYNPEDEEGHQNQAAAERAALIDALRGLHKDAPRITGRVLFLSGDVHFTELRRASVADGGQLLEFTSSAAKRGGGGSYAAEDSLAGDRFWSSRTDTFGGLRIRVHNVIGDRVIGTITMEACGPAGEVLVDTRTGVPCRSVWDLDTGTVS